MDAYLSDAGVHIHFTTGGENGVLSISLRRQETAVRGPPVTCSDAGWQSHGQGGWDNGERDELTSDLRQSLRVGSLYGFRGGEREWSVPGAILLRQLLQDCMYGGMEPKLELEQDGDGVVDDVLGQLNETGKLLN